MIEQVVADVIEKSLVGGAFLILLFYFLGSFSKSVNSIAENMVNVSNTLDKVNTRLESVEQRLEHLERG